MRMLTKCVVLSIIFLNCVYNLLYLSNFSWGCRIFSLKLITSLIDDLMRQVKIAHQLQLLMNTSAVCRSNDITGEYGGIVTVGRSL